VVYKIQKKQIFRRKNQYVKLYPARIDENCQLDSPCQIPRQQTKALSAGLIPRRPNYVIPANAGILMYNFTAHHPKNQTIKAPVRKHREYNADNIC